MYHTRLSIGLTKIFSSAYSTTIGWMRRMAGIPDLGGASFLMFVKDGGTSYMNSHSTWVCIFNAPMVPLPWTR